jgi:two-component system alkaline phosphatase synthesis response regulator PhoP
LPRVFIIADESEQVRKLRSELTERGFDCLVVSYNAKAIEQLAERSSDIVLLNMDETWVNSDAQAEKIKQEKHIPVIALLSREKLNSLAFNTNIDDFVIKPWEATEVIARIKRILRQKESIDSADIIRCGDLVIDSAKCEVLLSGNPIILTFKEYQLLKFLANNKGKVFTREALLNKVWGWDYYGGDRTVDVHIRRLRSKIEDINHSFIETIRNIGYRFTEPQA